MVILVKEKFRKSFFKNILNSKSKGQAAMEFLMTYGWAILIILVAIGALYFMGVFSPQVSEKCVPKLPFAECNLKLLPGAPTTAIHEVSERWPPQAIDANPILKSIELEGIGTCVPTCTGTSECEAVTAPATGVSLKKSGAKATILCTWTPAITPGPGLTPKANYKGSITMSYKKGALDKDITLDISGAVQ